MNPTSGRLIAVLVAMMLVSGCLSSPELELEEDEGPAYERRESTTTETGPFLKPGVSAWAGVGVEFFLSSYIHTFQRPAQLHEAQVVFRWSALTDDVFEEVRLIVQGAQGSPWKTVSGSGDQEFTIDAETWDSGDMSIWVQPWSASAPVSVYVDWEYAFEITFVEMVPTQQDERARGTGGR